jgi:hypothetical protein
MSSRMHSVVSGLVVAVLVIGGTAVLVRAAAMNTRYNAEVQRLPRSGAASSRPRA